jgi:hypothetical protein
MMNYLFENEYIRVNIGDDNKILEVVGKQTCDDFQIIKELLSIIEQCVKEAHSEKIIFQLEGFNTIGNDTFIYEEFLPYLGKFGVSQIAVITGKNQKTKVFFEELGQYLSPVRKQYRINSKLFENTNDCFKWINKED